MLIKMKVIFLLPVAAVLITGCATTAVPSSQAKKVSTDRIYAYQSASVATTSSLVVTRDEGFLGGGCFYGLWINDILSARLDVAETALFHLEPGEYVLRSGRDPEGKGLCGIDSDNWTQRETLLKTGERKYFRLSIDVNGKTDIQRSF